MFEELKKNKTRLYVAGATFEVFASYKCNSLPLNAGLGILAHRSKCTYYKKYFRMPKKLKYSSCTFRHTMLAYKILWRKDIFLGCGKKDK
jgi:hypothetical protein